MPLYAYRAVTPAGEVSTGELDAANEAEIVEQMNLRRFTKAQDITLWHAKGCKHCGNTGYTGRICILEMLPITDHLRSMVMKHAIATDLRAEAVREGMLTMYEDGLRKALKGVTTFEEVLRVTRDA